MIVTPTISRRRRRGPKALIIAFVIILIAVAYYINSLLPIITGYAAKNLASGVFVSERTQEDMETHDLNFSFIALTNNEVDVDAKSVTSRFLWGKSTAIFREGFGVTLLRGIEEEELRAISFPDGLEPQYSKDTIPWPLGDILPGEEKPIDFPGLNSISDSLILDNAYGGDAYAFMVLHKGIPVIESYKKRFNKETKFLSWSMAKSVMNALLGIKTLNDERFDIYKPFSFAEWNDTKAEKGLTFNNLMQMQSGLSWNEDYGNRSDVTVMLHEESDFAAYAYKKEFDFEPGTHWYYSSGTTNFVSYLFRKLFESDKEYYAYPYEELFYKIGITDAIIETDPLGTFITSSYLYMTARDYARFALLYLQDGEFFGERILPEGWVEYTTSEASASEGEYGSFFWLNRGGELPSAPADMYMCVGHDGQRIFILPSQELIIVVLGYSPDNSMDFDRLLKDILKEIED